MTLKLLGFGEILLHQPPGSRGVQYHNVSEENTCAEGLLIMRDQVGFALERHVAVVAPLKGQLTGKGYQVARYAQVHLTGAPVEVAALDQPHEDMVAAVLQAYEALHDVAVADDDELVHLAVRQFYFGFPVEQPVFLCEFAQVGGRERQDFGFETVAGNRIFDGAGQLVDFDVNGWIAGHNWAIDLLNGRS